ncbi:MAG: hypothetical protein LBN39_03065 [Planctomycetaceae bacterium]|jgi:hypothetical protein|nr:hypothetical protein [Planctomycetaceae bacterium]
MKRLFLTVLFVLLSACLSFAQSSGGSTGSGSGSTGSSGSSTPTSGELGSTVELPEFQGFQTSTQTFIGIPDTAQFVGVDDMTSASGRTSATSSRRNTSTTRSATSRRTSSSRTSASRTMAGRSGLNSNTRSVRAETTADFGFSPLEVANRETVFRTRLPRLNLSIVPEQLDVKIGSTPEGTVATLNGTVATQRDRKLLQQLLLLEPGIDKVDNKLTVSADSKTKSVPVLE